MDIHLKAPLTNGKELPMPLECVYQHYKNIFPELELKDGKLYIGYNDKKIAEIPRILLWETEKNVCAYIEHIFDMYIRKTKYITTELEDLQSKEIKVRNKQNNIEKLTLELEVKEILLQDKMIEIDNLIKNNNAQIKEIKQGYKYELCSPKEIVSNVLEYFNL
jgi:cellobiose phosphorylase